MSTSRVRVVALACGLLTALGSVAPASAGKPPVTPPLIEINSVDPTPMLFAQNCGGTATLTASGYKGKTSVWMLRPGWSPTRLGAAVKGVATTYDLGSFDVGETIDPMAFELRDNKNRMLARDEMTVVMGCAPGLQVISVDVVPHPTRTGDCSLPITWQPNLLPAGETASVIRRISHSPAAWSGIATVTTADIGIARTESVTDFPAALVITDNNQAYTVWLEYMDGNSDVVGRSNVAGFTASCPRPPE